MKCWCWLAIFLAFGAHSAPAQSDSASATNAPSSAEVARREFELGATLMGQNQFAGAAEAFEHAALLQPRSADAFLQWGVALLQLGKASPAAQQQLDHYRLATEKFAKAVELRPDDRTAYLLWGETLTLVADLPLEARLRLACYQGAAAKYQKVTELTPQEWEPYNKWGELLANKLPSFTPDETGRQRLYRGAADLFGKAADRVRYSADVAVVCANWGTALSRAARYTTDLTEKQSLLREAIAKFERSARAVSNTASTYTLWGATLLELGKLTRLRSDLRDGITQLNAGASLAPNDPATYYSLACGYALMDNTVMAVESLKQCFAADAAGSYRTAAPRDPDLAGLRGQPSFEELFQAKNAPGIPAYNPPLRDGPR